MSTPISLRARWVFPVAGPPLDGGVVTIADEQIVSVERSSASVTHDLGDVAIIPGLVNAHTHLEFSELRAPLGQPSMRFADWVRLVIAHRRARAETAQREATAAGLAESTAAGVTTLGEIASLGWPFDLFESTRLDCTVFQETLGFGLISYDKVTAANWLERLRQQKDDPQPNFPESFVYGGSPHAPYSTPPNIVKGLAEAASDVAPVAMHLAETLEEIEILRSGTGPLREMLEDLGLWQVRFLRDDPVFDGRVFGNRRPLDYLQMLSAAARVLVVHGNYLDAEELAFIAGRREQFSVIYCPRTHQYFGHERYPLREMHALGIRVALGTDSRASNPDLNLWKEMQTAAAIHSLAPDVALQMATLDGAAALGRDKESGTIETGKLANLTIVQLPRETSADPHEALLQGEVCGRVYRGKLGV